jgi:hypothetical protein
MPPEPDRPEPGARPRVFQIGLSGLGTRWLRRVFRSSGYAVASGESDRLAASICFARRTDGRPLAAYPSVDLFTDLESGQLPSEPPLFGQEELPFLHRHFPDAYFLLNVGDVDAWVEHRATAAAGIYRRAAAHRFGVDEAEVPGLWRRRWAAQEAAARERFAGYARFAVFDVEDQGLAELAAFVSPDYRLTAPGVPEAPPRSVSASRPAAVARRPESHRSPALVTDVVEFATRTDTSVPGGMAWRRASRLYVYWDGADTVRGRYDKVLPCVVDRSDPRWPFLFDDPRSKHRRTEGVLNELWQHGGRVGAHVDMQDARRYGVPETGAPDSAVLTFCRLAGAANLVLWPLPGYHTPGAADFPSDATEDVTAYADKLDSVAWRGNLTGRALPELGTTGPAVAGDLSTEHAADLAALLGTGRDEEVVAALETVPRYRLLSRLAGRPDADVGLVLGDAWRRREPPPQIARLVGLRLDYPSLYRHRYLLSLSGNDSASNFLKVADSNSVVLREEDGWEWFYDGLFRPWEHYVPLVRGGDDLAERLEWARAHPAECEEMSRRARLTVRALVDAQNRRDYLTGIREVYEARFRPK